MKQQRVKFAVETTPPECLFDHSTIFDYSFIFPAAVSLSVVLLSFELLYQHYIATINDICGPNKAMERWILSGSVTPRLDSIYSLYNYWMFVYFSCGCFSFSRVHLRLMFMWAYRWELLCMIREIGGEWKIFGAICDGWWYHEIKWYIWIRIYWDAVCFYWGGWSCILIGRRWIWLLHIIIQWREIERRGSGNAFNNQRPYDATEPATISTVLTDTSINKCTSVQRASVVMKLVSRRRLPAFVNLFLHCVLLVAQLQQ